MRHHRSRNATATSFEELLSRVRDLPQGFRGQIFDGTVHVSEPPSAARAHTLAEISAMLVAGSPLGDPVPEGWSFLSNPEIAAGEDGLLVADAAGWKLDEDRLAAAATPIAIAPAWVGEVLGGGTRTFTLTAKRRAWLELGVRHLWIADPEARVLEVFENAHGHWTLVDAVSDQPAIAVTPFDALRFDVADLWLAATVPPPSKRHPQPEE